MCRPFFSSPIDDQLQHIDGAAAGMHCTGTQPCRQGHAGFSFKDHHRKILILIIAAVPERQLLFAMGSIVCRIEIDNHACRLAVSRTHKGIDQKLIESGDAFDLSTSNFKEHIAVFDRLPGFASSVRMLKPVHSRATGGRSLVEPWVNSDKRLEERIMPQQLSIITIGIPGENLLDLLTKNLLGRVCDKLLRPRIRQPTGGLGEKSELSIQPGDRQQACVRDDSFTLKVQRDLLAADFKQLQLRCTLWSIHLTPPVRC